MSDVPGDVSDRTQEALLAFVSCVGEALDDICSYGLTVGETHVPFDPDPDEECDTEEAACSQVWVRVTGITPDVTDSWSGDCATVLRIGLEVGVVRCFMIPEGGEAITASEATASALLAMDDMKALHCAAMNCEVWESISAGDWNPFGPLGGQFGGIWTFTVEL